jgi:replicative DNA helicase
MVRGVDEEAAVLGAILTDGLLYKTVADTLLESDFYKEEHRLIWRSMTAIANEGGSIDSLTVTGRFKKDRDLTRAGGSSYISSLADQLPDVNNIKYYALKVKESSNGRRLRVVGQRLQDDEVPPNERIEVALGSLTEILKSVPGSREAKVGDVAADIFKNLLNGNGKNKGLMIGFPELDVALDGLNKDSLVVLGARPSIGKSAFALQVSYNVASAGKCVLYVSPEMSKEQLTLRLLSVVSGIPYMRIKNGKLPHHEMDKIKEAKNVIVNLPLIIDDTAEQTVESSRMAARRLQASSGIDLLVVDYLQLLCAGDDSKEAVTVVSKGLKAIAKDLHIPVLAVTQLSRNIEYRDDKRPKLSDIRGSGQIEQDADAVLFIWNPSKTKVEVFIEKNRNGPLGATTLTFDKDTTKFSSGGW